MAGWMRKIHLRTVFSHCVDEIMTPRWWNPASVHTVAGLYGTQWFGRPSRLRIDGTVFRKRLQNQCRSARIALETPRIERARNFTSEIYPPKKSQLRKKNMDEKKSRKISEIIFFSENPKFQIFQKIMKFRILKISIFRNFQIFKNFRKKSSPDQNLFGENQLCPKVKLLYVLWQGECEKSISTPFSRTVSTK